MGDPGCGFTRRVATLLALSGVALVLAACASLPAKLNPTAPRARALFETFFEEELAQSPEWLSILGRPERSGEWDDYSPAGMDARLALFERQLERLRAEIDPAQLDPDTRLSFDLFVYNRSLALDGRKWREHDYPVNQMFGVHSSLPSFLISTHRVADVADAEAYIARLRGIPQVLEDIGAGLERRAEGEVILPAFLFPKVIRDIENLLAGRPFDADASEDSTLLADFRAKVEALELPDAEARRLLLAAGAALSDAVGPAYQQLRATLMRLQRRADARAGVWKLPEGADYYDYRLRLITGTDLSAEAIHQLGLQEVSRIHEEMRGIMRKVGFEGELRDFFRHLRKGRAYRFDDTEAGRAGYLQMTRQIIDGVTGRLPDWFERLPAAGLEVRPVEAFREASAGKAFYRSPSADGARPGIYYINLSQMDSIPWYGAEALAYHEALPGHHLQITLAQEADLPSFRRYAGQTAYTEGWALYAELLPREGGLYTDPYSDFGRLSMELWRACRLVVDTGLHDQRWSRKRAMDYLRANTPNSAEDITKSVDRYIVMPAQATAYKIGMLEILALREEAREALGDDFDIRKFHALILDGGPMPLPMLRQRVEAHLAARP